MNNFYRQQFPFNSNLEHVRNELSRQILEINLEKRQKGQEIKELEYFANQTEDSFLFRKIESKFNQLEELKTNIRNRLNQNFHDVLEDILETKKELVRSNL